MNEFNKLSDFLNIFKMYTIKVRGSSLNPTKSYILP